MTRRRISPGLRARLLITVVVAITIVVGALTVGFNLVLAARLDGDVRDLLRARAASGLAALGVRGGQLVESEAPDQPPTDRELWVFAGRRTLERPRTDARVDRAAASLARGTGRWRDVPGTDTRLYALPVSHARRRIGTVIAGLSLEPYERTARTALLESVVFAGAVLIAVAIAARWVISGALRPVARMTAQAAVWSERDLERRFALGEPRDELTRLAAVLDGLLERVGASLRREQRFSAELSHELRTPLANVVAEAQLALRHERGTDEYRAGFAQVLSSARRMQQTLDTLLAAVRLELDPARGTSDAYRAALAAAEGCTRLAAENDVGIVVDQPPRPLRLGTTAEVVERILTPMIANACRYARTTVRVSSRECPSGVQLCVEDDGPGVPPDERESIFEPGRRGTASARAPLGHQGAGLGLALSRRLAHAAGGDVHAEQARGGARFVVELPGAHHAGPAGAPAARGSR